METDALRRLLTKVQRDLESAPVEMRDKLRALQALSVLAACVARGATDSPEAFAEVATLLERSDDVPTAKRLRPAMGWLAL